MRLIGIRIDDINRRCKMEYFFIQFVAFYVFRFRDFHQGRDKFITPNWNLEIFQSSHINAHFKFSPSDSTNDSNYLITFNHCRALGTKYPNRITSYRIKPRVISTWTQFSRYIHRFASRKKICNRFILYIYIVRLWIAARSLLRT